MRRILTNYLNNYSRYGLRRIWQWEFVQKFKDDDFVQKLKTRRGFLYGYQVSEAFTSAYWLDEYIESPRMSPINKLLLFSGLLKFIPTASIKAIRYCTVNETAFEVNIGCATLSKAEILDLFSVILKKYYTVKHQCDMRQYLNHLSVYIPWQSLTTPLKRFPVKDRAMILNTVGRIINSYTTPDHIVEADIKISIW